eukprot:COSAG03_NODE_11669_length_581_cov_1.035270_1_plen_67_part_00
MCERERESVCVSVCVRVRVCACVCLSEALRLLGSGGDLTRAVFVASRHPLDNALLREAVPDQQRRH